MDLLLIKFENICSPQPIAAGIESSEHLIDICELTPPYLVIRPTIFCDKIQSYPGSAFSIITILSLTFTSLLGLSIINVWASIIFFVIKYCE